MSFVFRLKSYLFSAQAFRTVVIYIIRLSLLRQSLVLIWTSFILFLLICVLHFSQYDLSMLVFSSCSIQPFSLQLFYICLSLTLVFRHFIRVFELFLSCSMLYSLFWKHQNSLNAFSLVFLHVFHVLENQVIWTFLCSFAAVGLIESKCLSFYQELLVS